jgi:hypothetical protein
VDNSVARVTRPSWTFACAAAWAVLRWLLVTTTTPATINTTTIPMMIHLRLLFISTTPVYEYKLMKRRRPMDEQCRLSSIGCHSYLS